MQVKDPNKPLLRLYSVPPNAFDVNYVEQDADQEDSMMQTEAMPAGEARKTETKDDDE